MKVNIHCYVHWILLWSSCLFLSMIWSLIPIMFEEVHQGLTVQGKNALLLLSMKWCSMAASSVLFDKSLMAPGLCGISNAEYLLAVITDKNPIKISNLSNFINQIQQHLGFLPSATHMWTCEGISINILHSYKCHIYSLQMEFSLVIILVVQQWYLFLSCQYSIPSIVPSATGKE